VKEAGDCPTFRRFLALTMVTESGFSSLSLPPSDEYLECTVMLQGAARTRTKTKGRLPVSPLLPDFLLENALLLISCLPLPSSPPSPPQQRGVVAWFKSDWSNAQQTAVRRTLLDRP